MRVNWRDASRTYDTKAVLFADETSLFFHGRDKDAVLAGINDTFTLQKWFNDNTLSLNIDKP